jgi:uncharacterized cupredoxin-like copper-binding protein
MTAYYVLGIAMVVLAVVLSAVGLTREGFPPTQSMARAIIGGTAVLVLIGASVLLLTTHKEHPREEAAEKAELAAERSEEGKAGGEEQGKAIRAVENEFSIELTGGNRLVGGKYVFDVLNEGKIEHDLAIEGEGVEEKTPLIGPGKTARLPADLKPGEYRFWCTVPGHAESGMETDVTVR